MKLHSRLKFGIAIFLIIALFAVLNFTGFSKNIKNFFFLVSSPIQKSLWQAGKSISGFMAGILEINTLRKEIENLRFENQELFSQIVAMIELKKENEILRETLGLGLEKEFELMFAQIINKDIAQDSILINRGEKDGILEGWPVITGQKVLLGRIGQVYGNFSEVILISNKESSFGAKIPEKEIYGIVKGKGSFNLYFDLIPKDKDIFENDIVITSALGGVYPQGLLVGEIKTIRKSDIDPFQTAEITPFFNVENLDYLFVIKGQW